MNGVKRCLNLDEKSDIVNIIKEDIVRDQLAINNIMQNRELVTTLATRSPDELIEIYNSHLVRSNRSLLKIDIIPIC